MVNKGMGEMEINITFHKNALSYHQKRAYCFPLIILNNTYFCILVYL